jgi:tight adherence protein C
MMTMLLVLAALAFAAAIVIASETVVPSARRRQTSVAIVRRWSPRAGGGRYGRGSSHAVAKAAEAVGQRLTTEKLRRGLPDRIAAAGFAGRLTVESFVAMRIGLAAVGALGGLALGAVWGASAGAAILLTVLLGTCAFLAPGFWLNRRARARRDEIHRTLPEALDLLAVTVEAGLGLYGAIQRLVETTTGALADEFALVLTELRVGESSERALKRMATRMNSPEVSSFVRSLIQGEQLGLSLGRSLRNIADDTRNRQRADAEETAAKAPVKMLFPTALFIFPALFIVILGPAVLEIKTYL